MIPPINYDMGFMKFAKNVIEDGKFMLWGEALIKILRRAL